MIRVFYTRVQPPCEILIYFFFFWPHHVACGILVPQPRIEPVRPAVEVQSANHLDLQGIPLISYFGYLWLWNISFEARSSTISKILKMSLPLATWNHVLSCFSYVRLCGTLWTIDHQGPLSMGFSRQEYWSGFHALLQGIFLIQESNPSLLCLLHWQSVSLPPTPLGKPVWNDRRGLSLHISYKKKK